MRPRTVASTAAAFVLAITVGSCGSTSRDDMTGPGSCTLTPNFIDLIDYQTWRSFPLSVYIERDELERRGYSSAETQEFAAYILTGFGNWQSAGVGAVQEVTSITEADFFVVFRSIGCPRCAYTSWSGDGSGHIQRGGSIVIDPGHYGSPGSPRAEREAWIAGTAAHEFGHVLGIVGHPDLENCLMCGDSATSLSYTAPTAIDVNTVRMMYGCP